MERWFRSLKYLIWYISVFVVFENKEYIIIFFLNNRGFFVYVRGVEGEAIQGSRYGRQYLIKVSFLRLVKFEALVN